MTSVDLTKVNMAINWFHEVRLQGGTIFVAGNGGSAATASHFVCDLLKGASHGRETRFRILALTDNLPTLTAYSNDVGYDAVFVEQLKNFAQPGDLYVAVSGSGNSSNVIRAMEYAKSTGCRTLALTGCSGGKLASLAELNIHVPAHHMGCVEDVHMIICHMIAYYFMQGESGIDAAEFLVAGEPANMDQAVAIGVNKFEGIMHEKVA
jgi:D-sedoheptulose 7-phosphate isomerase